MLAMWGCLYHDTSLHTMMLVFQLGGCDWTTLGTNNSCWVVFCSLLTTLAMRIMIIP